MTEAEKVYRSALRRFCQEVHLDFLPCAEADQLLRQKVTLEDLYVPQMLDVFMSPPKAPKVLPPETVFLSSPYYYLLVNRPGEGKTFFCKRLALALLAEDQDCLNYYRCPPDGHDDWLYCFRLLPDSSAAPLPLYIDCRYAASLSPEELEQESFPRLLHRLFLAQLGLTEQELPCSEFIGFLDSRSDSQLLLLLDDWDALEPGLSRSFAAALDGWLCSRPDMRMLLTVRPDCEYPQFSRHAVGAFSLSGLSDENIRLFCQRWSQSLLDQQSRQDTDLDPLTCHLLSMRPFSETLYCHRPLDLSVLLTICKDTGHLPRSKAELVRRLVEFCLTWTISRTGGPLTLRELRIVLCYLSAYAARRGLDHVPEEQVGLILARCFQDLRHAFSRDLSLLPCDQIVSQLVFSDLISFHADQSTLYSPILYSPQYDSPRHANYNTRAYLTACAIAMQYAEPDWNQLLPADIVKAHLNDPFWHTVGAFLVSMRGGSRILRTFLDPELLDTSLDDCLWLLGAVLSEETALSSGTVGTILDLLQQAYTRKGYISAPLDFILHDLSSGPYTQAFRENCQSGLSSLVSGNDPDFCLLPALGVLLTEPDEGRSVLQTARQLMDPSLDDPSIARGAALLRAAAWKQYAWKLDIRAFISQLKPLPEPLDKDWIETIKLLLRSGRRTLDLLLAVREVLLAGMASFEDFFSPEDVARCRSSLLAGEDPRCPELVLSMTPVFGPAARPYRAAPLASLPPAAVRCLEQLEQALDHGKHAGFSFSICAALGCLSPGKVRKTWRRLAFPPTGRHIPSALVPLRSQGNSPSPDHVRCRQLEQEKHASSPVFPLLPALIRSRMTRFS